MFRIDATQLHTVHPGQPWVEPWVEPWVGVTEFKNLSVLAAARVDPKDIFDRKQDIEDITSPAAVPRGAMFTGQGSWDQCGDADE